jgi:hypothetical protein
MALLATVIIADADKADAIGAMDSACGYSGAFTSGNSLTTELTDSTNTFWAMSGWFDHRAMKALVNNNYVHYVGFEEPIEDAIEEASLSIV